MRLVFIIFCLWMGALCAQERLGVLPLEEKGKIHSGAGKEIALLIGAAVDPKKYQLKERIELTPLLQERLLRPISNQGTEDFEVDCVIMGTISQSERGMEVSYRLVDLAGTVERPPESVSSGDWENLKLQVLESLVRSGLGVVPLGYSVVELKILYSGQQAYGESPEIVLQHPNKKNTNFRLSNNKIVPEGNFILTASQKGYETYSANVLMYGDGKTHKYAITMVRSWLSPELRITAYGASGLATLLLLIATKLKASAGKRKKLFTQIKLQIFSVHSRLRVWQEKSSEGIRKKIEPIAKEAEVLMIQFNTLSEDKIKKLDLPKISQSLRNFYKVDVTKLSHEAAEQEVAALHERVLEIGLMIGNA